mgnify:FL=1
MPWKSTGPMEERKQFVLEALSKRESFSELCRQHGVSRRVRYKWVRRFLQYGPDGLRDQPRVPYGNSNAYSEGIREAVIEVRKNHRTWGPNKIKASLERERGDVHWLSRSTIHEILKAEGLTKTRRRRPRSPKRPSRLTDGTQPNHVWTMDHKGWFRTLDGQRCVPLTVWDHASRYCVGCHNQKSTRGSEAQQAMEYTFREYGLPEIMRSDNGAPFASASLTGLTRFAIWLLKLGIILERTDPGQPQQNGRHERGHLTLKQETANPPASTYRAQQRRFDQFLKVYNFQRPHEGIDNQYPADLYTPSSRSFPQCVSGFEYSGDLEVRLVTLAGQFKFAGARHYLGQVLAGERIGIEKTQDQYAGIYVGKQHIAWLDKWREKLHPPAHYKREDDTDEEGKE